MADTLFVTGRLAEPALRSVLGDLDVPHQVAVMNITVAALMTTRWIARRLELPDGVDRIVLPGLVEGDVDTLAEATGLPVEKGPVDVLSLPEWYGREAVRAYWTRQWEVLDPHVEPLAIDPGANGSHLVKVHQVVRNRQGDLLADTIVYHFFQLADGMIVRMDILPAAPQDTSIRPGGEG